MLTMLKRAAGTWIAKIFLGVLILSFAVWGITGASFNVASGTLASVGSAKISTLDFQRRFMGEVNQLGQQVGRRLTSQQARQFGIDQQVLGRLINQAALNDRANVFGVGISQELLEERVLDDPAFKDADGNFNAGLYQQLLILSQTSEDDFLAGQRAGYARGQIVDALTADIAVPQVLKEAINTHNFEERTIEFLELNSGDIETIEPADDSTLSTYFEENKTRYRAPEYRSIQYISVQTSDFNGEENISDADARAYFEENKSRFEVAEERRIRRIIFHLAEKAQEAADKIAGGMTFNELAAELGLKNEDLELGTRTKRAILDRKLAEAAFELDVGKPSGATETDFGHAIIIVDEKRGGVSRTFDEAKSEIKTLLAADQNNRTLSEKLDVIEEARIAGESFEEIAEKHSVTLKTVTDVARSGELATGGQIDQATPALNALLNEVFDTDIAVENEVIEIGRDGYLWFEVTDVKEARDRTLDEVKERVAADWLRQETDKELSAEAARLVKELEDGGTMTAIAERLNKDVGTVSGVKRGDPAEGLSGAALGLAFSGPEGHVTVAPSTEENQTTILKVTEINQPEAGTTEEGDAQLVQSIQNDVIETYIIRIRDNEGTSINQDALEYAVEFDRPQHGGGHYR